jgi:endogenous inhibitor of DNA gyrase (YacG/DUF329 family)
MSTETPRQPPTRQVSCPRCRGVAVFDASNPWRPFCSERCRTVDLGAWASESYRVGGPAVDDLEGSAPPGSSDGGMSR